MTHSNDLPARIARLERLLDGLQDGRGAAARERTEYAADRGPSALDRLRDVAALLQERATRAACDEGDAIAMRALLEELTSVTANLRELVLELEGRMDQVGAAVDESHGRLKALEELE